MTNPRETGYSSNFQSETEKTPTSSQMENPEEEIEEILESYLRPQDLNRPPSADWVIHRSQQIGIYGEDSILALLPEELAGYAAARASRVVSALRHGGFRTLQELAQTNEEEILKTKGIGTQSIPLISAMQRLAIKRLLERSRPSD